MALSRCPVAVHNANVRNHFMSRQEGHGQKRWLGPLVLIGWKGTERATDRGVSSNHRTRVGMLSEASIPVASSSDFQRGLSGSIPNR